MESFENKIAVVTGGASGIGYAICRAFANEGARLVIADVERESLRSVVAEFAQSGVEAIGVPTDVSDRDAVFALADAAVEHFGALHVAVNNAGVGGGGPLWEVSEHDWEWILGVDLRGVIYGIQAFVPRIVDAGGGHIVNTASMAAMVSMPFMGPYNVAKHGVLTLSETLFHELSLLHPEVGVSVLCPGWVRTQIHMSDRNRPEPVADLVDDTEETVVLDSDMKDLVAGLIESGIEPSAVAQQVVEAVKAGQLYVLTHPDWMPMARTRVDHILSGTNPQMVLPTQ